MFQAIRRFRMNSIFFRDLLIVLLIVLLPISALCAMLYYRNEGLYNREIAGMAQSYANNTMDVLDAVFRQSKRLGAQLSIDSETRVFFQSGEAFEVTEEWTKKIIYMLRQFVLVFDHLDSIYLYAEGGDRLVTSLGGPMPASSLQDCRWRDEYYARKAAEPGYWFESRTTDIISGRYRTLLTLYWPAKYQLDDASGLVIINIDMDGLSRSLGYSMWDTSHLLYIVDDSGEIYYSNIAGHESGRMADMPLYHPSAMQRGEFIEHVALNGAHYILSGIDSGATDMRCLVYTPLEYYAQSSQRVWRFTLSIFCFAAFISLLIAVLIALRTYSQMHSILQKLTGAGSDSEDSRAKNRRKNEMDIITESITGTVTRNRMLEESLANNLILLNRAQTIALQWQMNPHFLHNTLEAIRMRIMIEQGDTNSAAAKMILQLSQLFRASMQTGEYLTTIGEEIEYCRLYIEILKPRYTKQIDFEWRIPQALFACKTVKMSLQPIIENAIYHGIKPQKGAGRVVISGRRDGDDVVISVEDNGVGMPKERIDELNHALKSLYGISDSHVGMSNTNQRIKLIFGAEHGVRVEAGAPCGTCVHIIIPYISEKEPPVPQEE